MPRDPVDVDERQVSLVDEPWGTPVNLGPTINTPYDEYCTSISPDGHWLVYVSGRPPAAGNCGTGTNWNQDLWVSHRKNKRDDFGWETPHNLGCIVNSGAGENGPALFEDDATGKLLLYYSSGRPGGLGVLDIYVSEAEGDAKDVFGLPSPVVELNTTYTDYQPVLRKDGREIFFVSNRPGGLGTAYPDLWTATRMSTTDPWSDLANLGPVVNSSGADFHPTLSFDGTTLYFATDRSGGGDLWMTTRTKVRGKP